MRTQNTARPGLKALTVALALAAITTACADEDKPGSASNSTAAGTSAAASSASSTTANSTSAAAATDAPASSSEAAPSPAAPAKSFNIGLAECDSTIPFLGALDKAVVDTAKSLGSKATVLTGKRDAALEVANVDTLIQQKVDGILVVSCNPSASVVAIKRAKEKGIPVFAVNAKLPEGADIVTYIGSSDFDMGKKQGELLVKAVPGGGKVAVIMAPLGGTPQVQRLAGLKETLKAHPEFEIAFTQTADYDPAKVLAITQDLLSKYPANGELKAIVGHGPEIVTGAEHAAKVNRKDVVFIGADYNTVIENAIRSGVVYGTVDQPPAKQGELAAKYMIDYLSGNKSAVPTPEFIVDTPFVTKDTIDEVGPAKWK